MKHNDPGAKAAFRLSFRVTVALLVFALLLMGRTGAFAASDTLSVRSSFHHGALSEAVDSILVVKRFRHMYVFHDNKLLKVYKIALGDSPVGPKHFKDDRKTPEGIYYITARNAVSAAHKSLRISYPNEQDRQYARRFGRPTGGDIMIHGKMNGDTDENSDYGDEDWTWGCIAVSNKEIDELYDHVTVGAVINILP